MSPVVRPVVRPGARPTSGPVVARRATHPHRPIAAPSLSPSLGARLRGRLRNPRRSWAKTGCLAFLVVVAGGLLHVWLRMQLIHVGYALSRAGNEERRLTEENRALRIEVAMLRRPERIARLASERLGMRAPARTELLAARIRRATASSTVNPPAVVEQGAAPKRGPEAASRDSELVPMPVGYAASKGPAEPEEPPVRRHAARMFSYLPVGGVSGSLRFEGER